MSVRAVIVGLAWTADSEQLVFSSNHAGLQSLWRARVSGGDLEPVPAGADLASGPSIAVHGNHLAFVLGRTDTNIWKAALFTGKNVQPVKIAASTKADIEPSYSPDGQRIAFASERSGNLEIYVSAADGSGVVQLTSMKAPDTGSPQWSPDGKQIVFDSRREGHSDIYVISAEGGTLRCITTSSQENETPSWSHDGRWIYYSVEREGHYEIWKIPADGGTAVRLAENAGLWPSESGDAKSLYYASDGISRHDFGVALKIM